MDSRFLLALCLFCGLEVDSQTFPHLTFGVNNPIPNHGYVDIGTVGEVYYKDVRCHTDLTTCCTSYEGIHRGQWYFPNGQPVSGDFYIEEWRGKIELHRRNNLTSPTGIYRCDIPTNAVHDDTDTSVRASVYVGLYTSEGKCTG